MWESGRHAPNLSEKRQSDIPFACSLKILFASYPVYKDHSHSPCAWNSSSTFSIASPLSQPASITDYINKLESWHWIVNMQRHKLLFLAWNWPMLVSEAWLKTNKQKNTPVDNIVRHVACFVLGMLAHGSSLVQNRESHKASRAPAKWLASFLTSPELERWSQRGKQNCLN